jgi:hypothetical protein
MPELAINFDPKSYLNLLSRYPKIVKVATPRAINKALKQASNVGVRAMAKRYNLKVSRIKRAMSITRATTSRALGVLKAQEKRRGGLGSDRPGLISYKGTSQKVRTRGGVRKLSRTTGGALQASRRKFKSAGKGGVTYSVIRGRKQRLGKGFIAAVSQKGNRAPNVFKRTGVMKVPVKGSYKGRTITRGRFRGLPLKRELIKRLVGPSIPSMFLVQGRPAAAKFLRENFGRIFANQVAFARQRIVKTQRRKAA